MNDDLIRDCMAMIKSEEGWRSHPYDCGTGRPVRAQVGKVTIGYGFNIQERGIPPNIAEAWLRQNVIESIGEAASLAVFEGLSHVRKMALVDMVYQMGLPTVTQFKRMLRALSEGRFGDAAKEIEQSAYAVQTPARAHRKQQMIELEENPYL